MTDETLTEAAFDLLDWIKTGTVARRQVVIFTDHEAHSEAARITAEMDALGWTAEQAAEDERRRGRPADGPLSEAGDSGTADQLAALERELGTWSERLDASRMVWTVRAISQDEAQRAYDAIKQPSMPLPPKEGAAASVQEAWAARVAEVNVKRREADELRQLHAIAAAVESVETPAGVREGVTVDELKALRGIPHGAQWIEKLAAAMDAATTEDIAPPVPTSPARSTSTRG